MLSFSTILAGYHHCNVGGEQVIHLMAQGGLHHQLGTGGRVSNCYVEKSWPTCPVHYVAEWYGGQEILKIVHEIKSRDIFKQ